MRRPIAILRLCLAAAALSLVASVRGDPGPTGPGDDGGGTGRAPAEGEPAASGKRPRRLLFLGNSITLHGPAPEIGWTGNWGMAATAENTDFVHLLAWRLADDGTPPELRVRNIAEFERGFAAFDAAARLADDLAFEPDLVVLAIGENVAALAADDSQAAFAEACGRLMKVCARGEKSKLVVRSSFWPDPIKDGILRRTAAAAGAGFVDVSALAADERNAARSERKIDHAGVGAHPGDRGMQAIADALWPAVSTALEVDWSNQWIGYSELRTNLPGGRHANARTTRAIVVRADGASRREIAPALVENGDTSTQFAGWSPDGSVAIIHQAWKNADTASWEEENQQFRFTPEGCRLDGWLVDPDTGRGENVTAVDRVSFYNGGVFFWPGDPSKLGFTALIDGASHPFRMDRDGRNKTDLTRESRAFSYGFSSSPDGRRVAFHQDYQIVIADADGSNARRIETGHPFNFAPVWSPDGTWLLFVSGEHYDCHPHVVGADGAGLRKLADRGGYRGVVEFLDVPDFHGGSSDTPIWSHDGRRIFYTAKSGDSTVLRSVDLDGRGQSLVDAGPGTEVYHPQLSRDGQWMVYGAKREGVRQLCVLRLSDLRERQITRHAVGTAAMWPHWRPVAPGGS